MCIRQIKSDKKLFLDLLLLGDEQESMIDRYLERGDLFILDDNGLKVVCVITDEGNGLCEIKNIATCVDCQRMGYGKQMIFFVFQYYRDKYKMIQVGTGDDEGIIRFYETCGFVKSHRLKGFFTDNYDHPIFENGIQLIDMVYLRKEL